MRGVYGENALLGSFYQAGFLKFFGHHHVAWRLSNIVLIIPITIFFFAWMKNLFDKRVALIATILLQCSFFLANYLKIGYINPQAFTLFLISLYVGLRCIDKPTVRMTLLLGITLGISFYIYLGPIFPFFLLPYLFFAYKSHGLKKVIIGLFFIMVGYTAFLIPALLQVEFWIPAARKTIFSGEFENNLQILINIIHNFFLFYANFDYLYNHFIAGPYLDIITRILAFLGIIVCCMRVRQRNYALLLFTYITVCIVIGITSPYIYTPTTRGIFFIPFGIAFAGIMLAELSKSVLPIFIAILLGIVFSLNVYQSQIGVFQQTGYTGTAFVFKSLQEAKQNNQKIIHTLLISDKIEYSYRYKDIMRFAYGLHTVPLEVVKISTLECKHLQNTKILIFNYDKETLSAFNNKKCSFKPKPATILTPAKSLRKL